MDLSGFVFKRTTPLYNSSPTPVSDLGPLADLPGTWEGVGFNQIWRPNSAPGQDRFLELNTTTETIQFEAIPGSIPNRGFLQGDIEMFGVTYLQKVTDSFANAGIHIETGIWANVPATTNPREGPTVARLASIPHGATMLAQGTSATVNGPPPIAAASIVPFVIGNPSRTISFPESNLSTPSNFRSPLPTPPFPPHVQITQAMVTNPNSILSAKLATQTITHTTALIIQTTALSPISGGGTDGTAFLEGSLTAGPNASPASVSAIFWIETVAPHAGEPGYLQLQYTQTVLLNFNGLSWPHVSVANLKKVANA